MALMDHLKSLDSERRQAQRYAQELNRSNKELHRRVRKEPWKEQVWRFLPVLGVPLFWGLGSTVSGAIYCQSCRCFLKSLVSETAGWHEEFQKLVPPDVCRFGDWHRPPD